MEENVVFSKSLDNYIEKVCCVSRLMCKARVTLKLKKCKFFDETVNNLGHSIRPGRLEHAKRTMDAVLKLEHPNTKTKLRLFLVPFSVFRLILPISTTFTALLNKKLRNDRPKIFSPLAEKYSFMAAYLEEALISPLSIGSTENKSPVYTRQ